MKIALENQRLPLHEDADGVIRVAETRVTLDTIVSAFRRGATAEQIAQDFPVLDLVDVYAVVTFYLQQRETVERYLAAQRREGARIRSQMEARFDPQGIRERLMARRKTQGRRRAAPPGR